jgi:5-carboxymethyl-2-hydroxymuconate isomerase
MPHLIIEYSANTAIENGGPVDVATLVDVLHDAAIATGVAPLDALRTRAAGRDHYAIGDRDAENMFVAVTARLGAGRSVADKQRLIEGLMTALDDHLGQAQHTMMLSVEYQEIDPADRINKNNLRPRIAARAAERGERNEEPDGS